jgi:hypothetical protein
MRRRTVLGALAALGLGGGAVVRSDGDDAMLASGRADPDTDASETATPTDQPTRTDRPTLQPAAATVPLTTTDKRLNQPYRSGDRPLLTLVEISDATGGAGSDIPIIRPQLQDESGTWADTPAAVLDSGQTRVAQVLVPPQTDYRVRTVTDTVALDAWREAKL